MGLLAAGFWGAFFCAVALMLAGSLAAFFRSLQRVALTAALSSLISALFVVAYLGWLPMDRDHHARMLAHLAVVSATALGLMLMALLGWLRQPRTARRIRVSVLAVAAATLAAGWALEPKEALALSSVMATLGGLLALAVCIRSARRGDRLAWLAVYGVSFMLIALVGLSWIALDLEGVPWYVHAASAVAGVCYLTSMALSMWARYSYLIELREVMAYGPSYDPVTRMRSHAETGQLVGHLFRHVEGESRPVGVIAISIANLYALEQLHGRGAVNHALFICAGRLRRSVPADVEMGRLGDDGFLLLTRNSQDPMRLVEIARTVASRLRRPVSLATAADPSAPQAGRATWAAEVGVGVLAAATPQMRPAAAVTMARDMSRAAWSFGSRIAWFDRDSRSIAELPLTDLR
ncbi:diguanylate cyclase domain-containing protein [Caenimonas terrae]|uniref:Diguanylate cyclase domain-containing protein n=1 Tax=Caenimonas terrae TaxID=696074 RepID=A0ABW0NIG2_9BURK